jgi:hypothetical protein
MRVSSAEMHENILSTLAHSLTRCHDNRDTRDSMYYELYLEIQTHADWTHHGSEATLDN